MKKIIFSFLVTVIFSVSAAFAQFYLPLLHYNENALEPVMSTETVEYHHGRHVQTYVDNLNKLVAGTSWANASLDEISRRAEGEIYNNGAQILNHIIFFDGFAPENEARKTPHGSLAEAIDRDFGSFEQFKEEFQKAAADQFGSGWAWLVVNSTRRLEIITTRNAINPLKTNLVPILAIDVWEHSYYIDYRNKRADYLKNIWRIVDWGVIGKRYETGDYTAR